MLQEPLEWICEISLTQDDTHFLIETLVETSNVIRYDSITDVMYSIAVLHEVFFHRFFFIASLGKQIVVTCTKFIECPSTSIATYILWW